MLEYYRHCTLERRTAQIEGAWIFISKKMQPQRDRWRQECAAQIELTCARERTFGAMTGKNSQLRGAIIIAVLRTNSRLRMVILRRRNNKNHYETNEASHLQNYEGYSCAVCMRYPTILHEFFHRLILSFDITPRRIAKFSLVACC